MGYVVGLSEITTYNKRLFIVILILYIVCNLAVVYCNLLLQTLPLHVTDTGFVTLAVTDLSGIYIILHSALAHVCALNNSLIPQSAVQYFCF